MILINDLKNGFEQSGYHAGFVNQDGIYSYHTMVNDSIYIVSLVDYFYEYGFTNEKYRIILEQMKYDFVSRGYQDVKILSIVLIDNIGQANELFGPYDQYWIVERHTERLIIYENQPGNYLDAKGIIESLHISKEEESYTDPRKYFSLFNSIIIAINIIVYIVTELRGDTENGNYLLSCGAMYWPSVVIHHQYYRLFTHMFLHSGVDHLANNMLILAVLGNYLERFVGKVKFASIYFLSGIIAGIASMVYNIIQKQEIVSMGASGAIFGVVGAMLYVVIANRGKVENLTTKQLAIFVVLTLFNGFTSQGVDNMAHVGGFAAGFLIALLIYRRPKSVDEIRETYY